MPIMLFLFVLCNIRSRGESTERQLALYIKQHTAATITKMATKRTYHTIPYHTETENFDRFIHIYAYMQCACVLVSMGYGAPGINCSPYIQIVNCLSDAFDS